MLQIHMPVGFCTGLFRILHGANNLIGHAFQHIQAQCFFDGLHFLVCHQKRRGFLRCFLDIIELLFRQLGHLIQQQVLKDTRSLANLGWRFLHAGSGLLSQLLGCLETAFSLVDDAIQHDRIGHANGILNTLIRHRNEF